VGGRPAGDLAGGEGGWQGGGGQLASVKFLRKGTGMARVALIGKNSVEYVDKLLDIQMEG
jgi:hypothetical protein